jgi:hypothetical protein
VRVRTRIILLLLPSTSLLSLTLILKNQVKKRKKGIKKEKNKSGLTQVPI